MVFQKGDEDALEDVELAFLLGFWLPLLLTTLAAFRMLFGRPAKTRGLPATMRGKLRREPKGRMVQLILQCKTLMYARIT